MRHARVVKLLGLLLVCGMLSSRPATADELYGKIRGVVTDQTGAVVAGAKITSMNIQTGISKTIESGPDGSYEFLQLNAPGVYNLSAEHTGFKTYEANGIQLLLNQVYVLNIQLEVGGVAQEISVEAAPTQIQSSSIELGTDITGAAIEDLPLNGRNWIQLQQLQPGVEGASDRFGTGSMGTNFATNGAQTQQNAFYVNGVDTADISLNVAGVIPSPDAIAIASAVAVVACVITVPQVIEFVCGRDHICSLAAMFAAFSSSAVPCGSSPIRFARR